MGVSGVSTEVAFVQPKEPGQMPYYQTPRPTFQLTLMGFQH